MRRKASSGRTAFTLLEIIVSLAILGGSLAALGEVVRIAARNASDARALTRAQLLATSKLAEIIAGATPPMAVQDVPFEHDPDWVFTVEVAPINDLGLVAVRITVSQDMAGQLHPVSYTLLRWLADPILDQQESAEDEQDDS